MPEPDRLPIIAPVVVLAISRAPANETADEPALPDPAKSSLAPDATVVVPVKLLAPDNVSVPAASNRPPAPLIDPPKLPAALLSVSV